MKLTYEGPHTGGLDFPAYGIREWKPGEEREVPDELSNELLARGDFKVLDDEEVTIR